MVIQSSKNCTVYLIALSVIVLLAGVLFAYAFGIAAALILLICAAIIIALYYVAIGRTIIMDERGCKIVLGKYSKEYDWDEIRIKRLEPPCLGLRNSYHLGSAFFSIKQVRKPAWLDPLLYCTFCHPLSCFFVHFLENGASANTVGIYEAHKHSFVKQLQQWGVDLAE